jgi:hypothetical protein
MEALRRRLIHYSGCDVTQTSGLEVIRNLHRLERIEKCPRFRRHLSQRSPVTMRNTTRVRQERTRTMSGKFEYFALMGDCKHNGWNWCERTRRDWVRRDTKLAKRSSPERFEHSRAKPNRLICKLAGDPVNHSGKVTLLLISLSNIQWVIVVRQ